MMIIGCDLHTRYQQIAMLDTETGELVERRLEHESGEARAFYAGLSGAVRVGIEATGHTHWFEAMLAELGHELWMGDAAKIRASVVRKQKTDARDAEHLLNLLREDRFPQIWRPSPAERDLRQLVWHRQKLVWMRGAVKNQLHALAMGRVPHVSRFSRRGIPRTNPDGALGEQGTAAKTLQIPLPPKSCQGVKTAPNRLSPCNHKQNIVSNHVPFPPFKLLD